MTHAWIRRAALLGMAPLLAGQGIYTRAVTPRLPEPGGDRSGRTGNGPPLPVLIAGDSAGGSSRKRATPRDLLARLEQERAQPFDVAVLSLDVNDVTGAAHTATWHSARAH
ncbi:hypothetical protein DIE19_24615 [Burkholderia sp. Bp9126]|nr:hypothetical protein DIE19_24615 [Burkholderia sp. Bp9126]